MALFGSMRAAFSATMMLAAEPVMVRLPPTVATNEMTAQRTRGRGRGGGA
jgi:hypothetical protein